MLDATPMSFGLLVRILEILVLVFCGVRIIAKPYDMRKKTKVWKSLFLFMLFILFALLVANSFYTKYSGMDYMFSWFYMCAVCFLFFKIPFLVDFVLTGIYWINIRLLHLIFLMICSTNAGVCMNDILAASSWPHLMILGMCWVMFVVIVLCVKVGEKVYLRLKSEGLSLALFVYMLMEWGICELSFNRKKFLLPVDRSFLYDNFFLVGMLALSMVILIFINMYQGTRSQEQLFANQSAFMYRQYLAMKEQYDAKSQQYHDMKNQLALLYDYISKNHLEAAKAYLEELGMRNSVQIYHDACGIPVIDILLDSKIAEGKKLDILFDIRLSLLFCPLSDSDMSVLLGNLLDNALEAVQYLESDKRRILVSMKTVNDMFILHMENPYAGLLQRKSGRYLTTKLQKESHGFGIVGVKNIVESHGGHMEIDDSGGIFAVDILLCD